VSLRGQIPNPDHSLLPGMYVTIRATLGQQHDVFEVPQAALQRDATGPYVLVIGGDGNVARKDVVTDTARDGSWIVTSGVAAGDQVIVSGIQRAKVGQPAKGSPWQPPAPKPAANANGTAAAATTTAPSPNGPANPAPKPAQNDKASSTPDQH
jgi:membrane fusion protein (multidrug efflux system)